MLYALCLNETLTNKGNAYDGKTVVRNFWNRSLTESKTTGGTFTCFYLCYYVVLELQIKAPMTISTDISIIVDKTKKLSF